MRIINLRTPSPIIMLARRPNSAGVIDGPSLADAPEPDPDGLRSPSAFFDASGTLISGTFTAVGSYLIFNTNIKFNELSHFFQYIDNSRR